MPPIKVAGAAVPTTTPTTPAVPANGDAAALAALQEAIETHAKLALLAQKLPERLAAAKKAVDDAYERLGIRPPRTATKSGRRSPGELTAMVLDALPGTAAEIREALDLPASSVGPVLARLVKSGEVVTDGTARPRTYRRAEEA